MEKKKHNVKKIVLNCLLVIFSAVFIVCAGYLVNELIIIPHQSHSSINGLKNLYNKDDNLLVDSPIKNSSSSDNAHDKILAKFLPLLEKNEDTIGWLKIDNTTIDNPVFYKPDGNNYYIKRDADGEYNKLGSLFIGDYCSVHPNSKNLVIFGHNMEDSDEMFGQLMKFKKYDFIKQNPTIDFDTLYEDNEWKIIAVGRVSSDYNHGDNFPYANSDYSSEEEFNRYIYQARIRSDFYIEDDPTYDDDYLVLSTCSYAFWGERYMVLARKLRPGEIVGENLRVEDNKNTLLPNMVYKMKNTSAPSQDFLKEEYVKFYGEDEFSK